MDSEVLLLVKSPEVNEEYCLRRLLSIVLSLLSFQAKGSQNQDRSKLQLLCFNSSARINVFPTVYNDTSCVDSLALLAGYTL